MRPRRVLFWLHLATGLAAGAVVLVMSATGALLAVQRPALAFAERGLRVQVPAGAARLSLDSLAKDGEAPDGVLLRSDPAAPVVLTYGRGRALSFDPYTGARLGAGAAGLRGFFRSVEDWHRWLGTSEKRRALGRGVTGAANAAFLLLALSGLLLWRPGRWNKAVLWSWHNSVGAWSAPVLLLVTATGLVMSYPWANDLLYKAAGEAPPARARAASDAPPAPAGGRVSLEALASAARAQAPSWSAITLRLPREGRKAVAQIEETGAPYYLRSTLTLDAGSASVVKWEPAAGWSRGRRLRVLARFTHTGETGGAAGQAAAGLASLGGAVLAATGFVLAWRRFRPRRATQA